jgi:hypothetical protein
LAIVASRRFSQNLLCFCREDVRKTRLTRTSARFTAIRGFKYVKDNA